MLFGRSEDSQSASGEGSAARWTTVSMSAHASLQASASAILRRTTSWSVPGVSASTSVLRSARRKRYCSPCASRNAVPMRPEAPVSSTKRHSDSFMPVLFSNKQRSSSEAARLILNLTVVHVLLLRLPIQFANCRPCAPQRSEEHTSELQSRQYL